MRYLVLPLLILILLVTRTQAGAAADLSMEFDQLVDNYLHEYYKCNPSQATSAGFHQYDHQLEDYSKTALDAQVMMLKAFRERFEKIAPETLTPLQVVDRELVINSIKAKLLDLEEIRGWENNPDIYSSGINNSVFIIMERNFAPPAERLKSIIAREQLMPRVFDDARANLKNPPRIFTEIALEQLPGIIAFFRTDLPLAFRDVNDEDLQGKFKAANESVVSLLCKYQEFLRDDLLPRSGGDFRIGSENFRKKLLYEEMVDLPLDRLLEIGYASLRANQEWFKQTATKLDPHRSPQEVLANLMNNHPTPDRLLESVGRVLTGLRQFIIDHKIVTVPSPLLPIVAETPPFLRATTTAAMDTPGPFDDAKDAYYFVTLPAADWTLQRVKEHMEAFNYAAISSTSSHEAYPGHYTQFLWVQRVPSKVRKLSTCGSNSEGWAFYGEQLMLDQGYGNGDLKLRLDQLSQALLRDSRYLVSIEMHTGKMSYEQAIDFFITEGYQSSTIAAVEAKRGTLEPTYLVYTLGKLEILKLRDDYKKLRGDEFTLQEFHDDFLRQGALPIKLIRRAMLGNDSPAL